MCESLPVADRPRPMRPGVAAGVVAAATSERRISAGRSAGAGATDAGEAMGRAGSGRAAAMGRLAEAGAGAGAGRAWLELIGSSSAESSIGIAPIPESEGSSTVLGAGITMRLGVGRPL